MHDADDRDAELIQLRCTDFAAALDALGKLGLRVDMILPADEPQVARLSGHGVAIELSRDTPSLLPDALVPSFVVTRASAWHLGRAGMQYRDLIPDRQGGRFVASHIRVPDGGPVPDYVHYHAIRFQMIYCYRGWVRLVYEDQGEPFVMEAGECVLQPPEIRHRVLECSPGLEVIEVGSPAVHPTYADRELTLPNGVRERDFAGQRFVHLRRGFADDAMTDATGGVAAMRVRTRASTDPFTHDAELSFGFVLSGSLRVTCGDRVESLAATDAFVLPAGASCTLDAGSPDLEWLEVTLPA